MKRKATDAVQDVPRPKIDAAEMKRKLAEKAKLLKLQLAKVKATKAGLPSTHKPTVNATKEPSSKKINPYLAHREDQGRGDLDLDADAARARRLRRLEGGLTFIEPGAFEKRGEKFRSTLARAEQNLGGTVSKIHVIDEESHEATKGTGLFDGKYELPVCPFSGATFEEACTVPDWWDCAFYPAKVSAAAAAYWKQWRINSAKCTTLYQGTTHAARVPAPAKTADLVREMARVEDQVSIDCVEESKYVQRPKELEPVGEAPPPGPQPLMLTEKERKRIRKRAREEKREEERVKIQMGLIPPPEPKVKISNLARVLGEKAVADPSKMEQYVREQMAERVQKHELSNLARQRTPAERREKAIAKMKGDALKGTGIALYRLNGEFSDPRKRFKVDMNARQLYLSGVCLMIKEEALSMVIVEGGEKGLKKFKKLMMQRIKWDEPVAKEPLRPLTDTEPESGAVPQTSLTGGKSFHEPMECHFVWEGASAKGQLFKGFHLEECTSAASARPAMEKRKCAHFLDMVVNHQPLF